MRRFNVLDLKTKYINRDIDGAIEHFCIIIAITEDEFYKLQDHEEILIWESDIRLLKAAKIFEEWY